MAEKRPREFISPEARQCIDRKLYSLQESLLHGECSDSHLSLCTKWLSRKHFIDVCVERAVSSGLCGWPGCENEIKISKGKVKISLRNRRIEEMDTWDSYACSSQCQTLGQEFLKSISATSPYARDVAVAYLHESENSAVVEGMRKLKVSSEPVSLEIKERPQVAPVQPFTADISFNIHAQTMEAPMQISALTEECRKSHVGRGVVTPHTHQHHQSESHGSCGVPVEDATAVDVESDAAIWHEVLNSDMPDYLREDTSLLDHECFACDNDHYSNHVPISTFIVLWKALSGWQPLEMKDSSSTQRMDSRGLSTSKQRAEVLSSMVLQLLPEVAVVLGQAKTEDCFSRFVIGSSSSDESRTIPQICSVARERLASLISFFSMSSEIPNLNQDQWQVVTWVLLCALYSPPVLQNEEIVDSKVLNHIESLGVSCAEFFVLVRAGKGLVTTWGG